MKRLAYYLFVAGILVSLVLSGCTRTAAPSAVPSPKPAPAPSSTPAPAASPKSPSSTAAQPSGTLTAAVSGWGNDTFAPSTTHLENMVYWDLMYNYVAVLTQDRKSVPQLARWEISKDGMTYTLLLRNDVKFQNGDPLTAEDVKYSIEDALIKESINSVAPQMRNALKSIEVVDPYKLVLHMKEPTIQSAILTLIQRYVPIVPKNYREKVGRDEFERKPIGSGPYKLVEHKMGDSFKFEAWDGYWGPKPAFKTIIIKNVPEEATRVAMLKRGEADIINLALSSKKEVEAAGLEIRASKGVFATTIYFEGQYLKDRPTYDPKNPFLDIRVRKALNLAINRDEVAKQIYMGSASPAGNYPFMPGLEGWSNDWKPYPYDPQQAKKLLAEAGYPNGFKTTMYLFQQPGATDLPVMAQAVAMYWANIGVNVELQNTEWTALRPLLVARKASGTTVPQRADAFEDCFNRLSSGGFSSWSLSGAYEDTVTDGMIKKISSTFDFETRDKLNRQLGQIYYDNYVQAPVCLVDNIFGVSKRVGDWTLLPYATVLNLGNVRPR